MLNEKGIFAKLKTAVMEKIRVAFFAEVLIREYDGSTRTNFEIIDRIDTERFEFLFFCGVPPEHSIGHEVFHVPALTIPFNKDYKMASMYRMGPRIVSRLERFDPHLIHVATPSPLGYFALKYGLKRDLPVTTIYHTHFISYVKYYTKNAPIVTSALETAVIEHNKSFYNRCSRVYVPTDAMAEDLEDVGFDRSLMALWPRGIKLDVFSPDKRDEAYIQSLTGNKKKNILFASRLVWEKNLDTLADIYKQIEDQNLPYNLVIAGSGVAEEELRRIMPKAVFTGHVNHQQLSVLYASADYFLFTSVTETFGNVITEAMASGVPTIIADGGGSRSLVKEGINGYLCKPNEASDYLHKIQLLEDHPEFRELMIKQALTDVRKLSWDSLVHGLFADYEELSTVTSTARVHS